MLQDLKGSGKGDPADPKFPGPGFLTLNALQVSSTPQPTLHHSVCPGLLLGPGF